MRGFTLRLFAAVLLVLAFTVVGKAQTTSYAAGCQGDDGHQLNVTSFPDGAFINVDGIATGLTTPAEMHCVKVGSHILTVSGNGWNTTAMTVNVLGPDVKGNPKDTHISFALLPALTVGQTGPAGPQGAPGVDGATGPVGPMGMSGLSITGPTGPQGSAGTTGLTGQQGLVGPQGLMGIGSQGPTGVQGPAGEAGTNGSNALAGVWTSNGTYLAGQSVLRATDGGSVGPFFNLTGNNGTDPITDTVNWVYCCGTVTPPVTGAGDPAGVINGGIVFTPLATSNPNYGSGYFYLNPTTNNATYLLGNSGLGCYANSTPVGQCSWTSTAAFGVASTMTMSLSPAPSAGVTVLLKDATSGSKLQQCSFNGNQGTCTNNGSSAVGDILSVVMFVNSNSPGLQQGGPYTLLWTINF